jgi:hypothetical protein
MAVRDLLIKRCENGPWVTGMALDPGALHGIDPTAIADTPFARPDPGTFGDWSFFELSREKILKASIAFIPASWAESIQVFLVHASDPAIRTDQMAGP